MQETRHQFRESLKELEAQTLGGLDIVIAQLDRAQESISYQDVELAAMVVADDDRIDGRYLEVHQGMGQLARSQVSQAKEAFATRNVELAQDLVNQDREINRLNRDIFKRAVAIGDELDMREWGMFMILVARCLERIGDNTVDIAEQVVFVVTGLFREMAGSSSSA
jgi:phosphate transport system protein